MFHCKFTESSSKRVLKIGFLKVINGYWVTYFLTHSVDHMTPCIVLLSMTFKFKTTSATNNECRDVGATAKILIVFPYY